MPQAPQVSDRFNLTDPETLVIDGRRYSRRYLVECIANRQEPYLSTAVDVLVQTRNAGVWFTDIARYFGYPSASSASAAYVRACRQRNIEPRVRATNTRVRDSRLDHNPAWLTRPDVTELGVESDLTFGVEVETVSLSYRESAETVAQALAQDCRYQGYTHDNTHEWKVVSDGSLGGGSEVVSRVLLGTDGLRELRTVLLSLKQAGARVRANCGQHVHIGVEALPAEVKANIIFLHSVFQDVFLKAVKQRRHNGTYCRQRSIHRAWELARHWAEGNIQTGEGRYYHLNLQSFTRYGTFEVRSFQGSLNPKSSVGWIQLNLDFFHFCSLLNRALRFDWTDSHGSMVITDPELYEQLKSRMPATIERLESITDPNFLRPRHSADTLWTEWATDGSFVRNPAVRELIANHLTVNN